MTTNVSLRNEKKLRQRHEILTAAIELFGERGYDNTRVQDIIERVRISEATFFNYFPTKDALLEQYAISSVRTYSQLLRQEIEDESRSVPDRVRHLLRIIGEGIEQGDRQFMAVVATRSKLFYGGEGAMFEKQVLAQGLLVRLFEEGQARGEIRGDMDPRALAESLTGAYTFTIVNWLTGRWKDDGLLHPRLMRVAEIVLDGCRASGNGSPKRRGGAHANAIGRKNNR
jgi:AcrR family transcriptional regulator